MLPHPVARLEVCAASLVRLLFEDLRLGKVYSRSHDPVIRVYDEAGNVIETHEHKGEFKEPYVYYVSSNPFCSDSGDYAA